MKSLGFLSGCGIRVILRVVALLALGGVFAEQAGAQPLRLEPSLAYPLSFGVEARVDLRSVAVPYLVFNLPATTSARSEGYALRIVAPGVRVIVETVAETNGIAGSPALSDIAIDRRIQRVLTISKSEVQRRRLEFVTRLFPGQNLRELAFFAGQTLQEFVDQRAPDIVPVEGTFLVRRDACASGVVYRSRVIVSLADVRASEIARQPELSLSVSPLASTVARRRLIVSVVGEASGRTQLVVRGAADRSDVVAVTRWSDGAPVSKRLSGGRVIEILRRWARLAYRFTIGDTPLEQFTVERYRKDFSGIESACAR